MRLDRVLLAGVINQGGGQKTAWVLTTAGYRIPCNETLLTPAKIERQGGNIDAQCHTVPIS